MAKVYTYAELVGIAAGFPRMRVANAAQKERLYWYANLAIVDLEGAHLPFAEDEWTYTFTASTGRVALPTSNVDGSYAKVASINPASIRLKNEFLELVSPSWLDQAYPEWRSSSANSGRPQYMATVGDYMLFYRWPSADFVADAPLLYFRGFKKLQPFGAAADATIGQVIDTASPDFPPEANDAFIQLILRYAYQRQGFDDWQGQMGVAAAAIAQLDSRTRRHVGTMTNQSPQHHLFGGA